MKSTTLAALTLMLATAATSRAATAIICPPDAPPNVQLAAKEIRRYTYLRSGELPPIKADGTGLALKIDPALGAQEYRITAAGITGGSDVAVLYGSYRYAELLGVRFSLDGDIIPDERLKQLPAIKEESGKPKFELRGLQPFHDFPEGPDWWTTDNWLSVVSQATKMRMNFIGLHTYPFKNKDLGPEPTVWIGLPEDVNPDGTVKVADASSWYSTAKPMPYGCYSPMKTGDYSFGAAAVFPSDNYGSEVNGPDDFPMPKTPEAMVGMSKRSGAMLATVFKEANRRGIKTAVGTESPLDIPDATGARLKELGLSPTDPATLRKLYAGMFTRIQRTYPIDTYWIWGHEGEIDSKRFIANIEAASLALKDTGAPFNLGISGWGWLTNNFPMLHKALPKDVIFSAINMSVGNTPVSPNFAALHGRTRWAIPWLEDDGALTSIQLRAGRVRRDAVDAYRYGCNGLMGIFWRNRILSPNLTALAQAGWSHGDWSRPGKGSKAKRDVEVDGGETAAFLNNHLPPIYQTLRYKLRGYKFSVPNGQYKVTLHFAEPAYQEAGKRVFSVNIQGKTRVEHLDIIAKVGHLAPLDLTFDAIAVADGTLKIDFIPEVEFPSICAIEITGKGVTRKINCGGPEFQDYAADPSSEALPRNLPTLDLYQDWASAQFGPTAGPAAAAIFSRLDGNFPATSAWNRGPGVIAVSNQAWASAQQRFAFVDAFAALRPQVKGAGNLERFDWWLNTFRVTRLMGQVGSLRGELNAVMAAIAKVKAPEAQRNMARASALPIRLEMVKVLGALHEALLATLCGPTELGSLCNIEQQSMLRTRILTGHDAQLVKFLGEPLPASAEPWKDYRGTPRLVVMNARTAAQQGEVLKLKIVALGNAAAGPIRVHIRPLGKGDWHNIQATPVARAIFEASLPPATQDFEYYVSAGKNIWPATSPKMNQTVVVTDL